MPELGSRTWRSLNEYLLRLEAADGEGDLARLAVEGLGELLPADIGAALLDPTLRVVAQIGAAAEMARAYNERYRLLVPPALLGSEAGTRGWIPRVRWRDYEGTELYDEFARPYRLGFSGSTSSSAFRGGFTLAIQRSSGGKSFTEKDTAILDLLNPHLNNLLSLRRKLERSPGLKPEPGELRFCFPRLSPRESEAGALLCAGAGAREVAASMRVGLRTAETHVAHLYDKLGAWGRVEAVDIMRGALARERGRPACPAGPGDEGGREGKSPRGRLTCRMPRR
ncbi:MAG TPA: helix-turn-helix transcriptional regulator [Spirochaetales bacterium]|nr:helix-turn-helix transcriptional regulator [Spirochaetales bacterium]HRY54564.1 helix-turn-helix transcriptional regulator [Spirochaetia bacterium]HRZ65361.1 helix-turn-helix transcriptional regulator [Spirochaetia bacterium]